MQGSSGAWQEKGREEGARDACRGEKGWRKVSLGVWIGLGRQPRVSGAHHKEAVWHQG